MVPCSLQRWASPAPSKPQLMTRVPTSRGYTGCIIAYAMRLEQRLAVSKYTMRGNCRNRSNVTQCTSVSSYGSQRYNQSLPLRVIVWVRWIQMSYWRETIAITGPHLGQGQYDGWTDATVAQDRRPFWTALQGVLARCLHQLGHLS